MSAAAPSSATIAFESIDGPPPQVFNRLVSTLNDEATAQKIAVVSRNDAATYRVRGYMSAMVDRNKTTFGWVWDVYDTNKRRALRVGGEEAVAAANRRRDAWSAADEAVLRRMARNGMEKIAAFLVNPEAAPAAAPDMPLPTLVAGRDDTPEGAGIFRVTSTPAEATTGSATEPAEEATVPPAPKTRKRKTAAAAAPSTDGSAAGR